MGDQNNTQRVWLDDIQEVRDAEANLARAKGSQLDEAKERLAKAREALEESEKRLFPEKSDQDS